MNVKRTVRNFRALLRRRDWFLLFILITVAIVLFFISLTATGKNWRLQIENQFYNQTASIGFKVEHVLIEGRRKTSRDDLMRFMNLRKNDPIFRLNLKEMAEKIADELPWVDTVRIERKLPNTLIIIINESEPRALWIYQNEIHVVSANGEIIASDLSDKYRSLPIVRGDNAPQRLGDYLQMLEKHPLFKAMIAEAEWIGNRRWDIRLKNGILVRLPENDVQTALQKLVDYHQSEGLLSKRVSVIDLRLPDRAFVQTPPIKPKRKPIIKSEAI